VEPNAEKIFKVPYKQSGQLFLGDGQAHFAEVSDLAGPYFRERYVGRGLAVGDYDNDGRPDLVYSHNGGPVKLLRNATETSNHWIRLDLVGDGVKSNRNAIGSKLVIEAGGRMHNRWVTGGGSYLSASDRRVLVGLGEAGKVDRVTVTWPSGKKQEFRDLAANAGYRLTEGKDQAEKAPQK
jgi:hypothetical protein